MFALQGKDKKFSPSDIVFLSVIVTILTLVSLYNISDFGVTWDLDIHYAEVESYFDYFRTGSLDTSKVSDLVTQSRAFDKTNIIQKYSYNDIFNYGPFSDLIGGFFNLIFNEKLHLLDLTRAFSLHVIIFIALTVLLVYIFTLKNFGRLSAVIASLSLALFPRIIGHIGNLKDIPVMFFTTLTIVTFWKATVSNKWHWYLISGISIGLTAAVKAPINAAFIFIILVLWLLIINYKKIKYVKDRKIIEIPFKSLSIILYPIVAIISFFLVSPYYWVGLSELKKRLFLSIKWFFGNLPGYTFYMGESMRGIATPWHYPFVMIAVTTPLSILILAIVGIYSAIKQSIKLTNKAALLVLLWLFLTLGKFAVPGTLTYNGIRLFLDAVPALCILSGVGFVFIYKKLKKTLNKKRLALVTAVGILAIFLPLIFIMIEMHPYEGLYFNSLVGGVEGANDQFEVEYWGGSYREGVAWINENAEESSSLVVPIAGYLAYYNHPREDINLIESDNLGRSNIDLLKDAKKPIYIMYINSNAMINHYPGDDSIIKYTEQLKPVHVIDVRGATILKIFKIEDEGITSP